MADFPAIISDNRPVFTTLDHLSGPLGEYCASSATGGSTAATWPLANLAIYTAIVVERGCTITQMAVNLSAASGAVNLGIYDDHGNRVVNGAATVGIGVSVANITDTYLYPGAYFLACSCDNTTASFVRAAPVAAILRTLGVHQQTSGHTLPATATFATMAQAYVPLVIASTHSVL